tara:strand:- start:156 stop:437 length:282 start_codon:yes stop_codon:yes gene_type:complete
MGKGNGMWDMIRATFSERFAENPGAWCCVYIICLASTVPSLLNTFDCMTTCCCGMQTFPVTPPGDSETGGVWVIRDTCVKTKPFSQDHQRLCL